MTRTFVAVFPPPEVLPSLGRFLSPLRDDTGVTWVGLEQLHFTLRFFGDLDDERLERVKELTAQVAELEAPVSLRLGDTGTFPPGGRPRVYWIGLSSGAARLSQLAALLERGYEGAGLGRADRPFTPHLTVGRTRRMRSKRREPARARPEFRGLTFDGPNFIVRSVCVVASRLSPRGPAHTPLAEFLLSGEG